MPPPATAAPSVLTASPIQAAATSGSCHRNVCARNGRINTSTTAKMTTNEETRTRTTRGTEPRGGGGDGEEAAEDHDRDLDVELRPDCFLDGLGEARKDIGDDQSRDQREDEAAFVGQAQRP